MYLPHPFQSMLHTLLSIRSLITGRGKKFLNKSRNLKSIMTVEWINIEIILLTVVCDCEREDSLRRRENED
jgi:hypothetical protein